MNEELKVTLIQSPLVWENPEANRNYFSKIISEIQQETDLIILPEMFTTGFTMNAKKMAENMDGPTAQWMKMTASQNKTAITGSLIIEENNKFYNRLLFITPDGKIFNYDKKHLFTLANEQESYSAGTKKLIVEYRGWKICPMICYDLRFPVWARNVENYDALLYVANWPEVRINAWDVLLRARAIENVSYCIGVNRVGEDGKGFNYVGHSAVYDVLGERITPSNFESERILFATLKKTHLTESRKKLLFLDDKDSFKII